MFNFIKEAIEPINERAAEADKIADTAILEYSSVIDELAELSEDGTGDKRILDINVDDDSDIETETIEFNMNTGNALIPQDSTVPTQESSYMGMKEYSDFIQEAYSVLKPFDRESSVGYEKRVQEYASTHYDEYTNHIVQEGLFGFGMINIQDSRVPGNIIVDFGPMTGDGKNSGKNFITKLRVFFETNRKHEITRKQLESVTAFHNANLSVLVDIMGEALRKKHPDEKITNVWDCCTPVKILVPVKPADKYKIEIAIKCDYDEDILYYSWSCPIKSTSAKSSDDKYKNAEIVSIKNITAEKNFYNKNDNIIKESATLSKPNRFGFFNEEFDMGDAGDDTTPPSIGDENTENTSSNDNSSDDSNPPSIDGSGDDQTPTDTTSETQNDDKTEVKSNDVSSDIADKIAEKQNDETPSDDTVSDIPLDDDDDSVDETPDSDTEIDSKESDIDSEINALNDDGNSDMDADATSDGDLDVENMTIDDLVAAGTEKLKGMTIAEIKSFLSNGVEDENIQEAFFITSKNINKEIDEQLKICLGILNDNENL